MPKKLQVAVLCGGPSLERGISLNSARSVLDHLAGPDIEIIPYYFDYQRKPYAISRAQLYSNTPSDFDFKLHRTAKALTNSQLVQQLRKVDLVFPAMHGPFGEDGTLQAWLELHDLPFVGAPSLACKQAFDKHKSNQLITERGFSTLPSALLKIYHRDHKRIIVQFFKDHNITRAIVKPATGGSSIGVFSVTSPAEALEKAELIFSKRMDTRVVIEPFAQGKEFTVIILQNAFGLPVAIVPTEIEVTYTENQIFDYKKKYLPSRQVTYHCPPRFSDQQVDRIQIQAEQLFALFGMRDMARFDGWVLDDGRIWFSDFNPISGMEQNSFLFQQGARVGLSHAAMLRYVVRQACRRYGLPLPELEPKLGAAKRKSVAVLFGGHTSERQVSLMSGTNVWLKLRGSEQYAPEPYLLDTNNKTVWHVPYHLALNHTVEEIMANCRSAKTDEARLRELETRVRLRLGLSATPRSDRSFLPTKLNLSEFIRQQKFVFIALHGGIGEDGTIQAMAHRVNVAYNGSDSTTSELCIDKWATSQAIAKLNISGITVAPGVVLATSKLFKATEASIKTIWQELRRATIAQTVIVKPRADGCSSGIAHLYTAEDLWQYVQLLKQRAPSIPAHTFRNQADSIELPIEPIKDLLFERFIVTDSIRVTGNKLKYTKHSGWIEITIGVLEQHGNLHALNPSITVAEGEVLTVEEKFQGGTGINITPPPTEVMSVRSVNHTKQLILALAKQLGLRGYARIDAFMQVSTGNVSIIEVNTLPGLTPSTVLYHQGLAEQPALFPRQLLEQIIKAANY